jgi:membrane-associated phospholipid phosphatase
MGTLRLANVLTGIIFLQLTGVASPTEGAEPRVWQWQTWIIDTPDQYRPPAPPDFVQTSAEIRQLKELIAQRTPAEIDTIAYWDKAGPSYRWNDIAVSQSVKLGLPGNLAFRNLALLHVAIHDAMVAVWDSKHAYNRPRPSAFDASLSTVLPNPGSPSYPSEEAAVAGAAGEVLSYIFPAYAQFFATKAEEAGRCRLVAGVAYPSDVAAGLELGRKIAARVIERAKADGSDAAWTGSVPTGPGKWTGTSPFLPLAGAWKTWILSSPDEFRPGPPPAYDLVEKTVELAELKNFARTPQTDAVALFWEYVAGGSRNYQYWMGQTSKAVLEYGLGENLARAARSYALVSVALADTGVACWDAKYAYWAIRPNQLDPTFKPLFTTPNHPSYPSGHSCFSHAAAAILGYLFPRETATFYALARQASESRIWSGLHFRSDVNAGRALGLAVANKVIERARRDGAD